MLHCAMGIAGHYRGSRETSHDAVSITEEQLRRDDADRHHRGGVETVYRLKPRKLHLAQMPLAVLTKD
jgi:hypothetical protein